LSPLRQANLRSVKTPQFGNPFPRITIAAAAGTVIAAAVIATGVVIGAAVVTSHSATPASAGQFGLDGDLGPAFDRAQSFSRAQSFDPAHGTVGQTSQELHRILAKAQVADAAARDPARRGQARRAPAPRAIGAAAAVTSGSPQQIAMAMLKQFGWSSGQFGCLDSLWERESGWNPFASNPSSGAYGIPQALPGSKMASAGADWATNAATQIRWGLGYIQATYGSPCSAWNHELADGWY
jgi:hypothetical protein